jgi:NAD-dependent dihydropyrimidine dehydrogenase PreA subunit
MKLEVEVEYYPGDTGEFLAVDEEKCTACGRCALFCARGVWERDAAAYRPVRPRDCVECGACWNVCRDEAVLFGEPRGGTGVRFSFG